MSKNIKLFLAFLVILGIIAFGCGGDEDDDKKKKEEKDKSNQETLKSNASVVANEARTLNLSVCSGTICATDGTNCNTTKPATQPGVCATGPILTCICPEFKVCFMVQNSTSQNPNTNASRTYVGNCKS